MNRFGSLLTLALATGVCAFAQPGPHGRGPGGPGDFAFMRGEFGFAGKVVTGAPYSAQAVRQFTQTLADGTHIQRSTTSSMARDSQGRTRTEETMSAIGPMTASGGSARTQVFIHDPVASMSYVLDPNAKSARQMQVPRGRAGFQGRRGGPPPAGAAGNGPFPRGRNQANVKREDLGTQVMQGITVQGTRETRTIPAGQAGNDRAMEVVTETWRSPDLQVVVMSKTSDPRMGESVYQLTNINRAEPDASLFSVPSGYSVQQGRPGRAPAAAQ